MSDQNAKIQGENLATIVAVTFVLALLALSFSLFTYTQISELIGTAAASDASVRLSGDARFDALEARIAALETELATLRSAPAPSAP